MENTVKRRSTKLTKEQSHKKLSDITQELCNHIGQPAILFVKDGRDFRPYLVELRVVGKCSIEARYKCYAPNGTFRCYLSHTPSPIALMTGEQQIVYFDEEI